VTDSQVLKNLNLVSLAQLYCFFYVKRLILEKLKEGWLFQGKGHFLFEAQSNRELLPGVLIKSVTFGIMLGH